jgi:membrane protein
MFDVMARMVRDFSAYRLGIVGSGIAYNEFFALFPAVAAAVSVYGLVADPQTVGHHMELLSGVLPGDAAGILKGQMEAVTSAGGGGLSLSLVISLALALYGAMRGVTALMDGLNIVYQEEEKRSFVRRTLVALGLTAGALVFGLVALALVAALPAIIGFLPLGGLSKILASVLRWPLLAVAVLFSMAVLYRYAPSRDRPRWRWVSWGAVVAAALWLVGSALFSLYVSRFGSFNKTYGSLAAVAVTLLWFQLTATVVLLGGLLNAELEHQTARDTTVGPEQPMGQRGAAMADTLGPERHQQAANQPSGPGGGLRRRR